MLDDLEAKSLLQEGDTLVSDGALYYKAEVIDAMVMGSIMAVLINPNVQAAALLHQFTVMLKTLRNDFVDA